MEPVVNQALGDIHGAHAARGLPAVGKDAFVHASLIVGQLVNILQPAHHVVGVEHGVCGSLPQAFRAIGEDVG
jgi:hypothetical protein